MCDTRGKDTLMKLLLSSGPSTMTSPANLPPPPPPPPFPGPPRYSTPTSSIPSPSSDAAEDTCPTLGTYLNQAGFSGQTNVFSSWNKVYLDHNYAKPGNESYFHGFLRPTRTLFINKPLTGYPNEQIDVETEPPESKPPYDLAKAQEAMDDFQKTVILTKQEKDEEEPEDLNEVIDKSAWSSVQKDLFAKAYKIVQNERLGRLTHAGSKNEPVLRRVCLDKSAKRLRDTFASVLWDMKLIRWLHSLLMENLDTTFLMCYLEVLQTLRSRVPSLIDKMIGTNNQTIKGVEGPSPLLRPRWDPVAQSIAQHKLKKLPGNPVIVMVPSTIKRPFVSRRSKFWHSHFADLGTVVTVTNPMLNYASKITTQAYLAQLVTSTKGRIAEVRVEYPRRPIILVGWRSGAALACQIAVTEPVSAVVCLGFAAATVEGHRGEPDDFLLDVRCPVLFVIGENSTTTRQEDLEDIREKMRYQTDLLVVGYADNYLRMRKSKQRLEGVTQSMVDRCILEEVGDFLAAVLISPRPAIMSNEFRREIYGRRRHNSTTSSVDSESSAAKRSRPATPQPQFHMSAASAPKALTVAQVNGNFKISPAKPPARGRRTANPRKTSSKLMMNSTLQTNTLNQVNASNGGITVNIGSLASLGPIGPLRMGGSSTVTSTATLPSTIVRSSQAMIEAAPPEMVMPIRDTSEEVHGTSIGTQVVSGKPMMTKGVTRLLISPLNNPVGNIVQTVPNRAKMLPGTRFTFPTRANVKEERKPAQQVRYVIASNSRFNTFLYPTRFSGNPSQKMQ